MGHTPVTKAEYSDTGGAQHGEEIKYADEDFTLKRGSMMEGDVTHT